MNYPRLIPSLLFATLLLFVIGSQLQAAPTFAPREADPVVISGALLTDFIGKPITDVVLFAYSGSWQPVPFQIDERMIEPDDTMLDYVQFEDGLIDADDELVFMARDAGSAEMSWPMDANATLSPRAKIDIVDPLSQIAGVVYLYDSTTLPRSPDSYVSLDQVSETVTAISYTLGLDSSQILGVDSLQLNGQAPDLIDRQKVRVTAGIPPFLVATQTEEDIVTQVNFTPFSTTVAGPVRLIEGGDFGAAYYGSRFDASFQLDIDAANALVPVGSIQSVRVSLDHNDPATTGVTRYADSNGANVVIDGNADAAVSTALRDWYQVSGGPLGGIAVTIPDLSITAGSLTTYYADDDMPTGDTGDGAQFADTGIAVSSPSGILTFQQISYVLAPDTATSVGDAYFQQATMPLSATVTSESTTPTAAMLSQAPGVSDGTSLNQPLAYILIGLSAVTVCLWLQRSKQLATI